MDIPDIPRLYTAFAEWAACAVFIICLPKRFDGARLAGIFAAALAVIGGLQYAAGLLPLPFWVPCMIAATLLMYGFIFLCCKISPFKAGCRCVQAFIFAEFVASLEWQLYYYLSDNFAVMRAATASVSFYSGSVALMFLSLFFIERRYEKADRNVELRLKELATFLLTGIAIFVVGNISFFAPDTPFSGRFAREVFYIRTLVDFCGIVIFYSYREQKLWLRAEGELAALQSVLARQYEQYCRQKESIETVNRKYHDIKYQIAVIRAEGDPQKRQAHLDAMESSIRFHEAQSKVGNTVLDTILSAKNMECFDKNISFSVVADGGLLDFIDVMDICSVFGNALDNAIESVATLREREKRIIKLAVYSKTGFLIIKVDNYCEAKLKYENGAISTTKTNPSDHGYGLKSIRLTAEKYGGTVTVNASDNWFGLCIVIPMPEGKS